MKARLLALLLALGPALAAAYAAPRPSVVFILADDLGWGDLRCYQPSSKIPTPNLDRLAGEGMRFLDAHSPSAVCSPTRYALLTGRYAWRTRLQSGVLWGYSSPLLEPGRPTIPSLLQAKGYRTAGVGKWHLGLGWPTRQPVDFGDASQPQGDLGLIDYSRPFTAGPLTAGFQTFFGVPASLDMEPYFYLENDRVLAAPTAQLQGSKHQRAGGGGFWRSGPAAPGFTPQQCLPRLAEAAENFLRQQTLEQPFFLYLALTAPHDPWVPVAAARGRSSAGDYGDFVVQVDDALGRLLRILDERGLGQHTLVVVTSDNGAHCTPEDIRRNDHRSNAEWRGMKADLFEGGHRVPLIVRWPARTPAGATTDALVGLQDWFATLADLAGVSLPDAAGEDSVSFRRVLEGKKPKARSALVHHSSNGSFAVREGPWKLLLAPSSGGWSEPRPGSAAAKILPAVQLYHLANDPSETGNLAQARPEIVDQLTRRLERIVAEGRSTPGRRGTNAAVVVLRKERPAPDEASTR